MVIMKCICLLNVSWIGRWCLSYTSYPIDGGDVSCSLSSQRWIGWVGVLWASRHQQPHCYERDLLQGRRRPNRGVLWTRSKLCCPVQSQWGHSLSFRRLRQLSVFSRRRTRGGRSRGRRKKEVCSLLQQLLPLLVHSSRLQRSQVSNLLLPSNLSEEEAKEVHLVLILLGWVFIELEPFFKKPWYRYVLSTTWQNPTRRMDLHRSTGSYSWLNKWGDRGGRHISW